MNDGVSKDEFLLSIPDSPYDPSLAVAKPSGDS